MESEVRISEWEESLTTGLLFAARSSKSRPASINHFQVDSSFEPALSFKSFGFRTSIQKNRQCGCGTCRSAASCQIISLTVYDKKAPARRVVSLEACLNGKANARLAEVPRGRSTRLERGVCAFKKRPPLTLWISNQARRPAEFKHITKRRKRN